MPVRGCRKVRSLPAVTTDGAISQAKLLHFAMSGGRLFQWAFWDASFVGRALPHCPPKHVQWKPCMNSFLPQKGTKARRHLKQATLLAIICTPSEFFFAPFCAFCSKMNSLRIVVRRKGRHFQSRRRRSILLIRTRVLLRGKMLRRQSLLSMTRNKSRMNKHFRFHQPRAGVRYSLQVARHSTHTASPLTPTLSPEYGGEGAGAHPPH